ncbi:MAG: transporter substrate-binding domain-containing protein [Desulfurivibrio sp.]|nr:transporter substrate-binding domain-containing protein [Desulfurivibrio sp.]
MAGHRRWRHRLPPGWRLWPLLFIWLGLALPAVAGPPAAPDSSPHLVLNSPFSAPITSPAGDGFLDLLYAELFKRLGISFEIQLLPGERALSNANAGIDDGDVCRIAGLSARYPNLVRSREPVLAYRMTVFSAGPEFEVDGPASLRPYRLGILSGWKILEETTADHPRRLALEETDQLFLMLAAGRLDLALIDRLLGREAIARLGLAGIKELRPPLLTGNWYLYLHRRHRQLLPAIDRELRRLKEDGSYQRIRRQTLGDFEAGAAPPAVGMEGGT